MKRARIAVSGWVVGVLLSMSGPSPARSLTYDFLTGQGDGLTLDPTNSASFARIRIEDKEGMSVLVPTGSTARVVFAFDAAGWGKDISAAALVIEYYDGVTAQGADMNGANPIDVVYPSSAQRPQPVRFYVAGRHDAQEPYRRATWRRRGVILRDFKAPAAGGAVELRLSATNTVRAAGLRPLTAEIVTALDRQERDMQDNFLRQTRQAIARVRVEARARELARADRYAREAGQTGWSNVVQALDLRRQALLNLMRESETLADRNYYEGHLAIVEEQPQALKALQDRIQTTFDRVDAAIAEIGMGASAVDFGDGFKGSQARVPAHPWAKTMPPYFRERIRFFAFANGPYVGPEKRIYEFLPLYGIEAMFRVTAYWSTGPGSGDDVWKSGLDYTAGEFALYSAHGLKTMPVALHIHHQYILGGLPAWFKAKYKGEDYLDRSFDGEQDTTGQHSGTVNLWHPGIRQYARDYAAAVGRQVAADTNLLGFSTFNEPRFTLLSGADIGYTPLAAQAFRESLRKEFRTIARLNKAWRSSYASFDEIQPPLPREKEPWQITPLFFEWSRFVDDSIQEYGHMIVNAFHATCPDKPVWTEGVMCNVADIGHYHSRPIPRVNIGNYNIRRLHRKTIVDAETAGAYPEGERENTSEVGRATLERNLFDALLWGQRGFDFWCRYFTSDANGYYAAFHDNPYGALVMATRDYSSLAVIRDKADRFGNLLVNTEVIGSGIGLVQPGRAAWGAPLQCDSAGALLDDLYTHGYAPFQTTGDDLASGLDDIRDYRALVFLRGPVVLPELSPKVIRWVKRGGLMVAEGPWGVMDPYGTPDGRLMAEAFGEVEVAFPPDKAQQKAIDDGHMYRKIAEPYRRLCPSPSIGEWYIPIRLKQPKPGVNVLMADTEGNPLLIEAPLGKGKVIMSAVSIYTLNVWIRGEIGTVLPSLAVCEKEGELYTVMRADTRGNRYLGLINPDSAKPLDAFVRLAGRYESIMDLGVGDGFAVPQTVDSNTTRIPVHLAPGEGTILRLGQPR